MMRGGVASRLPADTTQELSPSAPSAPSAGSPCRDCSGVSPEICCGGQRDQPVTKLASHAGDLQQPKGTRNQREQAEHVRGKGVGSGLAKSLAEGTGKGPGDGTHQRVGREPR